MADHSFTTSPDTSAAVVASAGTGKTWLLVTRLVRLLLAGATPDSILAITFTRKAAEEMQTRLLERLYALAASDDRSLPEQLTTLGVNPSPAVCHSARHLYEQLLRGARPVRFYTFHAFCQDILRRFPLEADVPPGFELLEDTGLLEAEAWEALAAEATGAPDGGVARSLAVLLDSCHTLANTRQAIAAFFSQRGDWWAYTAGARDPAAWASERLARQLGVTPDVPPAAGFFSDRNVAALRHFQTLLQQHPVATNGKFSDALERALDDTLDHTERFTLAASVFVTTAGELRKRGSSKTRIQKMGSDGDARFIALHEQLGAAVLECMDLLNKHRTLTTNRAWYHSGARFMTHYQRLKLERRQLDFTDLEWKACQLLNEANNAHWVQYKLDQRIDHILVDEFQDTNPTQWRLLLPLLEELAAGTADRNRSVFLVGDNKQSIYRFRRADPRLFDSARSWISAHLGAAEGRLAASWRSSPAIIDFINTVFGNGRLQTLLPDFTPHDTHRSELPGCVEILPLITRTVAPVAPDTPEFRNPLRTPRVLAGDRRFYEEGTMIAARIRALIDSGVLLGAGNAAQPAGYSDIIILVRNRTHVRAYEQALRDAGIPYLGQTRGTLMECLEVQDITNLLRLLIAPYDNLALASVLRSPLFDCSDNDLMDLAMAETGDDDMAALWINRLNRIAGHRPETSALRSAAQCLERWRALANQIPVHDLLDRIYFEANIHERYDAAFPAHLRARVRANLTRFIELALEVDSGRYPSLSHFLDRLEQLKAHGAALDEAPVASADGSVRIMTIHSAKGLEAGIIFLADTASTGSPAGAYDVLVDWPPAAGRPETFLLTGKKSALDSFSRARLTERNLAEQREEINLLYVALTRARQLLLISASTPGRNQESSWYHLICESLAPVGIETVERGWQHAYQTMITQPGPVIANMAVTPPAIVDALSAPLAAGSRYREVAPSLTADARITAGTDGEARLRGTVIHRMLEWQTNNPDYADWSAPRALMNEFGGDTDAASLSLWWQEARRVVSAADFTELFNPERFLRAYNEIAIQYELNGNIVHGIIDRLVIAENAVTIVDYKTHRDATADNLAPLAQPYLEQMRLYRAGVERLWRDRPVRSLLLFTACAATVAI